MMKSITRTYLLLFVLPVFLGACNPQPVGNQQAILEEMEDREIKRVTRAEIMEGASHLGEELSTMAQGELAKTLSLKIASDGFTEAIKHCNTVALPLTDSIAGKYRASIRRVSQQVRNPVNRPDAIETEILEAYEYALENGIDAQSGVQEIGDSVVLFTRPILISNAMCLNCHGNPSIDVPQDHLDLLQSLYPEDSATGYKIGDLRGMWSIRFRKKDIIRNMD